MTNLEQLVSNEIKKSMIEKNKERTIALRSIKSQFDILNSSGQKITEEDQLKSLQKMVKQRKESADIYIKNNRNDLSSIEIKEAAIIEEFLPKQLTIEEVENEIKLIISDLNPTPKEMGKIIGFANKKLSGKTDGKTISDIVKKLLTDQ